MQHLQWPGPMLQPSPWPWVAGAQWEAADLLLQAGGMREGTGRRVPRSGEQR